MAQDTIANLLTRANQVRVAVGGGENSASRLGALYRDIIESGAIGREYIVFPSTTASGDENRETIQAGIDAAREANGGRVRISGAPGRYPLTAPYRATDDIYPGYVANDENRRANKALIIYDAESIEMYADPGVVLDRSGDVVADTAYAPYSATIYVSRSSNIYLHDLEIWGAQDDAELLNDVKNVTSGASIDINNGCDRITLANIVTQDGSDGVRVGLRRTSAAEDSDPAIPRCTNIFVTNFENRNNEQGLLLCGVTGFEGSGYVSRTYTRANGSTGVTQRPLYFHSCRNVNITNVDISGAFKTSVLVANYDGGVSNVRVSNFAIHDMMTWEEIEAITGSYPSTTFNGVGISFQSDNCNGVTFSRGSIANVATGVIYPGVGMQNVVLDDVTIRAVVGGILASSTVWPTATLLDNPTRNLTLSNVRVYVEQDLTNYSTLVPIAGIYLDSFAVDGAAATVNAQNTKLRDVYVYAQNRPCRVFNSDGTDKDCYYERQTGYGAARNFEFNYSGNRIVEGITCPVFSAPNRTADVPTAALIRGRLTHFGDYAPDTVVSAPIGSVFYDQGGGAGVTMFVKESGVGTNTGWVAK